MSSSVSKITAERNQRVLMELVMKPGNDICADCKARAPRWASHNLGIFICVNCASIHRKIGTHITKVKSITLDAWSKEQVEVMKQNGNIKSNAYYNLNEARNPPPTNMMDSERDSELEIFIRAKYEFKRFLARTPASRPLVPPPRTTSGSLSPRPRSTPIVEPSQIERKSSPAPPPPPAKTPQNMPSKLYASGTLSYNTPPARSASQPLPSHANLQPRPQAPAQPPSIPKPSGSQVWDDLISLQGPSQTSSLPLQFQSHSPSIPMTSLPSQPQPQSLPTLNVPPNPFANMSLNQPPTQLVGSPMAISPGLQLPFGSNTPLGTPALNLGSTNPFNQQQQQQQQQFMGIPQTNGTAFSANPFPSAIGMDTAQSAQPFGFSQPQQFHAQPQPQGQLPALMAHPTGIAFTHAQGTQLPYFSNAAPQSPFSAVPQTPFGASLQQPFAGSPQSAFGTTPFLQQQQQQFAPGGPYGGWQGAQGGF